MGMIIMEDSQSHFRVGFGELLDLSSDDGGVQFDHPSFCDHHQDLCSSSFEDADFCIAARACAASGTIIRCLRQDFNLPSKPASSNICGTHEVLLQNPPRQNLSNEPVRVKESTSDVFQVRVAGKTQECVRLPTEVQLNNRQSFSAFTTTFVSPSPSLPSASPTVSISEGSSSSLASSSSSNCNYSYSNNLYAPIHRRVASDPLDTHNPYSYFSQTWPENTLSLNHHQMVKKRRSLQAIFVPSFLQSGALSLSPTLLSPTSPTSPLPPSPTPVTAANSFKQRARAHSAAAGKAARVLGEEALDAYVSLRSGFTGNTVSAPSSAGIPHDAAQLRPVSPPAASSSRRKPSISSIIQAIPSFSSGITGIALDADVSETPPTTPIQETSPAIKGPRASPPPSYLIDDDPFANLSGAPSEIVIRSTGGASGSSSASDMLPPTAPPIPPSPLKSSGQDLVYGKGKARSGSLSVPSSPPAFTPGFSHLPPPPLLPSAHGQHHSPRAFGSRGNPRPATQRPAFSSRPSLPTLNTLANMNIVLSRKPRKGKVGAGLPFEPWDNVDTPPSSAIDSPASPFLSTSASNSQPLSSPLSSSSASTSTLLNEASSAATTASPTVTTLTTRSLDLQPTKPALKPLLPSQIMALGSMAGDMEMAMMYESPVVSTAPVTSSSSPTSVISTSSSSASSTSTVTQSLYTSTAPSLSLTLSSASSPPQLPPLSLDFITQASSLGGGGDGEFNEEGKSPLEREFEAAVSPLSESGERFGVGAGAGSGYEAEQDPHRSVYSEYGGEEQQGLLLESRWEDEEAGRRQSVVAICGDVGGEEESDHVNDFIGLEEPALFAIRRGMEEEGGLEDVFSEHGDQDEQVEADSEAAQPSLEPATSYGYGYGYGYTPQNGVLLESPIPQDSYPSFSYSPNPDTHSFSYPDSTPLFSPPPSDWSRSRSISSTSVSSIDEALDLDFSALKRLSDAARDRDQNNLYEHQNFNVLSTLQYSPDVSIRSPAISANQFNYGVYETDKEKEKDTKGHSPNLLGDVLHLGLGAGDFFSRTRSSSFTPSIGSSSHHHHLSNSSSQPSEILVPSDEPGLQCDNIHARQGALESDVEVNDGRREVFGEEVIGLCAELDADAVNSGRNVVDVSEGLENIAENETGLGECAAEGGNGLESLGVFEDEREKEEVKSCDGGRIGRRASWLLSEDGIEGLASRQMPQDGQVEEEEVKLNLDNGLMVGVYLNVQDDIARVDSNVKGHTILDVNPDKLDQVHKDALITISPSPTTTTIPAIPSDPSLTSTPCPVTLINESYDIIATPTLQTENLNQEIPTWSGSEPIQSRSFTVNTNTQPIPVLGLIASESQDHRRPETAVDGASDSNINQLQRQPSPSSFLSLAPYPPRSSSLLSPLFSIYSNHQPSSANSQSPSPSASSSPSPVTSVHLNSQYFSASSSTSVSPRSSVSLREGEYTPASAEFGDQETMNRYLSDGAEGYSYSNGGNAQGGYSSVSDSRGSGSAGYHQASSNSRTAYHGHGSSGYSGGGGGGGAGGDDREDNEERRRRKLAEMGYVSRSSSSRRYTDATSGEEDEERRVYRSVNRAPPVPAMPQTSIGASNVQRYPYAGATTQFPVTSSSSRDVSDDDSDSSDDDVPLAQRIPGALKAQKTIRRQVREEKERRRQQRREGGRESEDDYRLRQDTLRPITAASSGGYGGGLSSSQEAAMLAASSVAASSGKPSHLREHIGRRQRTMTLPSKVVESSAPSSFNADDLVRKLQHVQMNERSSPVSGNLSQVMQARSKSISRTSGDIGDSHVLSSSPVGGLASRSRSIRRPTQQASASPLPLSPPVATTALPSLRPMRSFRRPSTADASRPLVPHQDYSARTSTEVPLLRRSHSQSRGTAERTYMRDEVVPPMPALPSRSPARTSGEEQNYVPPPNARKLVKAHQPGSLSRRPSVDVDGRSAMPPLNANTAGFAAQNGASSPAQSPSNGTQMRFFVVNLQQFNMVFVGPNTSAGDVVDMLQSDGVLTGWAGVGGWMVWEIAQDFGMERPVRSYELIAEVQASWLKEKTVNYFLVRMTPLAVPLSRHAIPSSSPTHSGYVEWEVKRGKWSKRWMMLKEHSLWISKRDNGRDEVLICSLSNFDAYQVTRNHRAPKPFAFAVKSTDNLSFFEDASDYMHSFSCQEKDGVVWLEKILVARSYVLHQERNVLFNPKAANGNGASVSRSATRVRKMSTAGHRSPPTTNVPLVAMPPFQAVLSQAIPTRNDVFEPGSLLAKHL